jgi:hypothetical protein
MQKTMKCKPHLYALFAVVFILSIGIPFSPAYSAESAHYRIDTDVLSGGGGECSSAGYYLWHTTGQPTAIGESSSASYINYAGFWYTLPQPQEGCFYLGDINCDNVIDITDVILVLRLALQLDPPAACSDINGDGGVDISDVILTLRMALGLDSWEEC